MLSLYILFFFFEFDSEINNVGASMGEKPSLTKKLSLKLIFKD